MRARSGWPGGFALLIVLWSLVLIAFIGAQVMTAGRTEIRIAGNLAANAAAQAAADGAIYEAIFHVLDTRPEQSWALDGGAHALRIGRSRVIVRLEDESGRVNPSLASTALQEGLLRVLGNEPETAGELARSISEWVGSATPARNPAEIIAEYRAAGLDYLPPQTALESIGELIFVRGMTPDILKELRPHLTRFGPAAPNPALADPVVAAAITLAGDISGAISPNAAAAAPNAATEMVLARISAAAQGPDNAAASRSAIVRIGALVNQGYMLLAWGTDDVD